MLPSSVPQSGQAAPMDDSSNSLELHEDTAVPAVGDPTRANAVSQGAQGRVQSIAGGTGE